ncbi:hypothetical protein BSKO_13770 [Bryopsis sp. KO-2023]|nr:hypothetical protein BSKO_13770 [Bryopsis sp. KO-2023]
MLKRHYSSRAVWQCSCSRALAHSDEDGDRHKHEYKLVQEKHVLHSTLAWPGSTARPGDDGPPTARKLYTTSIKEEVAQGPATQETSCLRIFLADSPEGSGKMVVAPQPTGVSVARLSGFVLVIVLANRDGMCFIQNFGVVDSSVQVMGEGTSAAVSGEFAAVGECAAGATGFGFAYVQSTVLAQAQRNGDECNSSVTSSGGSGSTIFGSGISVGTKKKDPIKKRSSTVTQYRIMF